jgi:hypothetical protein
MSHQTQTSIRHNALHDLTLLIVARLVGTGSFLTAYSNGHSKQTKSITVRDYFKRNIKLQKSHDKNLSTHPLGTDYESWKCWCFSLVCDNIGVYEQTCRFATPYLLCEEENE